MHRGEQTPRNHGGPPAPRAAALPCPRSHGGARAARRRSVLRQQECGHSSSPGLHLTPTGLLEKRGRAAPMPALPPLNSSQTLGSNLECRETPFGGALPPLRFAGSGVPGQLPPRSGEHHKPAERGTAPFIFLAQQNHRVTKTSTLFWIPSLTVASFLHRPNNVLSKRRRAASCQAPHGEENLVTVTAQGPFSRQ